MDKSTKYEKRGIFLSEPGTCEPRVRIILRTWVPRERDKTILRENVEMFIIDLRT